MSYSTDRKGPLEGGPDSSVNGWLIKEIGPLKDHIGHLCAEPQKMGEILNENFWSIFTDWCFRIIEAKEVGHRSCVVLDHNQITREEVLVVLKHIKVDKYSRLDQLLGRKLCVGLCRDICIVFCHRWSSGRLQSCWYCTVSQEGPAGWWAGCQWWESCWMPFVGSGSTRIWILIRDSQHEFVHGKSASQTWVF